VICRALFSFYSLLFRPAAIHHRHRHRHYTSQHHTTLLAEGASILVPATLGLFTTTWHDAYGGFFFWRFDGVCGGRQGWAGRGGLGGFSYDKTTGQNVYYEVILSGDGNSVHGPVWSGLVWFSVIWFGQVCLCDVRIA
jgi:hypothetical protein